MPCCTSDFPFAMKKEAAEISEMAERQTQCPCCSVVGCSMQRCIVSAKGFAHAMETSQ